MVLKVAKLACLIKIKECITCQKLGSCTFWQIADNVPNKAKSTVPPVFNGPAGLKVTQSCLLKSFLRTLICHFTCFPFKSYSETASSSC